MCSESIDSVLEGKKSQPQQLIEVLQDIQELYGYIPEEAMKKVAKELGVPAIEVWRVANYYKAFSLTPKGKHLITICMGTACHVRGANLMQEQILSQLKTEPGETTQDGLFTVEGVNCLGACALGPIVVLDGVYHDHMTPAKLSRMIKDIQKSEKGESV